MVSRGAGLYGDRKKMRESRIINLTEKGQVVELVDQIEKALPLV